MLESSYAAGSIGYSDHTIKECRPDPEDMFQSAKSRHDEYTAVLDAMDKCGYIDCDRNVVNQVIGALYAKKRECAREMDRWLKKMDGSES